MNEHRYIEERDADSKEALRKKTEEKLGFSLSKEPASEKKVNNVGRYFTIFATAVCAVCLIIALPFIIKSNGVPNDGKRFCKPTDFVSIVSDCNIKEYNERYGTKLLYLDYDIAEEVVTIIYVSKEDENDIIYFEETILLKDTYEEIKLSIMDNKTVVEGFDQSKENAISGYIKDVSVHWYRDEKTGGANFEYKGYKYYLEFGYPVEQTDIFDTIESMLK